MVWSPSIVILVTALGAFDLSSLITAERYAVKATCERDLRMAVASMQRLYPTLQIKFSGCVARPQ